MDYRRYHCDNGVNDSFSCYLYRMEGKMIEFKEKYPKLPNSNQWGAALSSVVDFMGTLQLVVKKIDARVSSLESSNIEVRKEDAA